MDKLWGGRFAKPTDELVDEFTASISFDQQLAEEDIAGSLAHVKMLATCGIITAEEGRTIQAGLEQLRQEIAQGSVTFSTANEDIHMNIEALLLQRIGPVAGKLHTGRSRNDQVALDMHLYLRRRIQEVIELLLQLQKVLLQRSQEHVKTILPGYTHLQRAQPVSLAQHFLAYFWMFQRDRQRLQESLQRVNCCPLGAGALAGTTFAIDRKQTATELGFESVYPNSMDAVSDRDFVVEFLSHAALIMMHISRMAEELIIWSSSEFGFIELDDAFCTGSSIMPQKKNPDVPELLRGKTGRVYGHLVSMLTVMKALPLAYNKDMQEDKEGMFDTARTLVESLTILAPLLQTMRVQEDTMRNAVCNDYSNATDLADYLVEKGLSFREAHEVVGRTVLYAIDQKRYLLQLSLSELQQFDERIDDDVYRALHPEQVVAARKSEGGTSLSQILIQIERAQQGLEA